MSLTLQFASDDRLTIAGRSGRHGPPCAGCDRRRTPSPWVDRVGPHRVPACPDLGRATARAAGGCRWAAGRAGVSRRRGWMGRPGAAYEGGDAGEAMDGG